MSSKDEAIREIDLIIEMLESTEVKEDGRLGLSARAEEITERLAAGYRESEIYKKSIAKAPEWIKTATAAEVYAQMCDRIAKAPTISYTMAVPRILLPILWEKLQAEGLIGQQAEDNTR